MAVAINKPLLQSVGDKINSFKQIKINTDTLTKPKIDKINGKIFNLLNNMGQTDAAKYFSDIVTKPEVKNVSEFNTEDEIKNLTSVNEDILDTLKKIEEQMVDEQDTAMKLAQKGEQPPIIQVTEEAKTQEKDASWLEKLLMGLFGKGIYNLLKFAKSPLQFVKTIFKMGVNFIKQIATGIFKSLIQPIKGMLDKILGLLAKIPALKQFFEKGPKATKPATDAKTKAKVKGETPKTSVSKIKTPTMKSTGGKALKIGGKVLSKVAAPLTVAMGVYEGYTGYASAEEAFQQGELTQSEATVKKGEAIGSAAGGTGGALAGAAAGAAMGSVVPVVGTIIGGLVGGAIGYFAGSTAGEALGGMTGEKMASVDEMDGFAKAGIVNYNMVGNSEILDWEKLSQLSNVDIEKLINFDDWSDEDKNEMIRLYQEKQMFENQNAINNVIKDININNEIQSNINAVNTQYQGVNQTLDTNKDNKLIKNESMRNSIMTNSNVNNTVVIQQSSGIQSSPIINNRNEEIFLNQIFEL